MSNVLRRIDAPTRYGGLSIKGWLAAAAVFVGVVLALKVVRTPVLPSLVAFCWIVAAPAIVLVMWAYQQGVPVSTLLADFARYSLGRNRKPLVHEPAQALRGGIVIAGELPAALRRRPTWHLPDELEIEV